MTIDISGTLVDAITCAPGDRGRMIFPESTTVLTRAELGPRANGVAAALLAAGAEPGEVVGVLLPATPSFPPALLGVLTIGAAVSVLPLPAVAHDVDSVADDLAAFIRTVGIRHLVTGDLFAAALEPLQRRCPGLRVVNADRCAPATRVPTTHTPGPDDRAVVQFTSGTTGRPQGVVLSHRAVVNGVLAPVARCELTPADVGYQWLPLFHDFGMIGLLISLCAGFDTHLVSPAAFIRRPVDALRYLGEHGVTICTGPNFAYDRLAEAARAADPGGLDLGRWRLALNGGEPVSPATVRAVTEVLGRHGLPAGAMTPAYGMAEYCAGITIDLPGLAPRTVTLDRAAATDGRVVPVTGDSGWTIVSQGPPLPGTEVRVVDAAGTVLPEAGVGELQVRGPSLMDAYLAEDSAAVSSVLDDGWLRTGDRGFLLRGEVHVAGRHKNMIIVRGRNVHAEEVEHVARHVPGVYQRHCVAVADRERERVVVVVETVETDRAAVAEGVRRAVSERLGITDADVRTVDRRWLPRTTSGKWKRDELRRRLFGEENAA